MVIYAESSPQAIWVKYTMPNPWTEDQLNAALGAYSQKWNSIISNSGMSGLGEVVMKGMMPAQAPSTFQSDSGIMANKTMVNELMVYSPTLFQSLGQAVASEEEQKRAVPKF